MKIQPTDQYKHQTTIDSFGWADFPLVGSGFTPAKASRPSNGEEGIAMVECDSDDDMTIPTLASSIHCISSDNLEDFEMQEVVSLEDTKESNKNLKEKAQQAYAHTTSALFEFCTFEKEN